MQKTITYLKKLPTPQRLLLIGWVAIMALLPFHALISTWGGTTIGPYELWKVWKEILLILLLIPAGTLVVRDKALQKKLLNSWIVRICFMYTVLHLISAAVMMRDLDALAYGLAINLRIVGFFLVSLILFSSIKISKNVLLKVLLIPCSMVLVFGLLQLFVLPTDFLAWFGYEKGVTIAPSINIDEQPDQLRIMSTLRGPNPLGAYLILPGITLFILAWKNMDWVKRRLTIAKSKQYTGAAFIFIALLIVLYATHGRASWIGFFAALGVGLFLLLPAKMRLYLIVAGITGSVVAAGLAYQYRGSSFVQNVILHDNPETGAEMTSNDGHLVALQQGLSSVADRPVLGCGPGCAGPASFYNDKGGSLSENYYVQVGQEVGVAGTALFVALSVLVGMSLWQRRSDTLALALFASLVGISLANLLLHIWADDTLAYIWWGLAGAVIADVPAQKKNKGLL